LISSDTSLRRPIELGPFATSPALEWLWKYLWYVRRPHILDCGPLCASTANILLRERRAAKLYVADLTTSLLEGASQSWNRTCKAATFRTANLLAQLPRIPCTSLALILCWQLLDLLPRDAVANVMLYMNAYLQAGGAFFCIVREPRVSAGVDLIWSLETLTAVKKSRDGTEPFPYAAITNREMEQLLPTRNVRIFLTRSGFRELLLLKPG
jgi:hypothetical protein